MAEKRITIKTDDPSKAEEMAVMDKLYEIFQGTNTYLSGLFTEEFVAWVQGQIRNDFPPDAYGFGIAPQFKKEEECENRIRDFTIENEDMAKRLEHQKNAIKILDSDVALLKKELQFSEVDKYAAVEKKDEARAKVKALEAEVVQLKVKLYDLLSKED